MSKWKDMDRFEQKTNLVRHIKSDLFDIHSNVCYLLNFCGLTQEEANKLSQHYNAIDEIITNYSKKKFNVRVDEDSEIERLVAETQDEKE